MAVNVGSAVATLNIDVSTFEKGMSLASARYENFIKQCEESVGFDGANKALSQLTAGIENLSKIEEWTIAQKIEGYERVQHLYEQNVMQQMNIDLKLHNLRKQQFEEEFQLEMKRIASMNTGDDSTTDYASMINAYESTKQNYEADYEKIAQIEEKITEAAEQRKQKILAIKREEIDGIIAENDRLLADSERNYNANKVLHQGDNTFTVQFYNEQIAIHQRMINELTAQNESLSASQQRELGERENAVADYYAKIQQLVNESIVSREKAEAEITEIVKRANEERAKADEEYYARSSQVENDAEKQKLELKRNYDRQADAINTKIIDDEARLTSAYEQALQSRKEAVTSYFGIFDKLKDKDLTGSELLENLQGQLDAIKSFKQNMEELRQKGMDTGLLSIFAEMGPSRHQEIAALNQLSEAELDQYNALYKEKMQQAAMQAESEMAEKRRRMELDLVQVRVTASNSIGELNATYKEQLANIEEQTEIELENIKKTWEETHKEIELKTTDEIGRQEAIIKKSLTVRKDYYRDEQKFQLNMELEKTDSARQENTRRETDLRLSVKRNEEALRESVVIWESVGVMLGNALLGGISGTRAQIVRYLADVAQSVNSASSGGFPSISVPVFNEVPDVSGSTANNRTGFMNAIAESEASAESGAAVNGFTAIDYNKLAAAIAKALPNSTPSINYNPIYNSPKAATISELVEQDKVNMRRLALGLI